MTNKTIFTVLFAFLSLTSISQPLNPSWEISLPSNLRWMQVNDWGILVASCETGLYGISPADGKKMWEVSSLTNVPEENYQVIEGTPLLMLADKAGTQQTVVINGLSGQLIFDSEKEKLGSIVSRKVVPEVGGLLIAYSNDAEEGVALYDYLSGSQKWARPFEKAKSKELQPQPLMDTQGNILYALGKNLYKLNGSTGEVLWQVESKKNYVDLFFHPDGGQVFAVSGSASSTFFRGKTGSEIGLAGGTAGAFTVESIDAVSGQATWKEPLTYSKSKYSGVALGPADFLLFHTFSTARIGYATGEPLWAKERMGTGGEKNAGIFVTDKGMGFAMQDAVGRNYLHFVNDAGEPLWKKKPVINGDIFFSEQTGNTVFYVSTQETNIVNLEDGSLLWQKDKYLSAGNVPISADREANGDFVMYIRGMLVRVMPARQDWEEITSGFAFNGELPTGLRIMPNGYLLTGNQNAMLLGRDGKVIYHQFYPAPEQSFGAKLALGVAGTAASLSSFGFAVSGVAYGLSGVEEENNSYLKKSQQQFAAAGFSKDVAGGLGALMSARFGEDAAANNYKLILTKKDKSIGFVKINLLTGEEEGQIVTDDRTPDFAIDAVGDRVFLKSAPERVACYGL